MLGASGDYFFHAGGTLRSAFDALSWNMRTGYRKSFIITVATQKCIKVGVLTSLPTLTVSINHLQINLFGKVKLVKPKELKAFFCIIIRPNRKVYHKQDKFNASVANNLYGKHGKRVEKTSKQTQNPDIQTETWWSRENAVKSNLIKV